LKNALYVKFEGQVQGYRSRFKV